DNRRTGNQETEGRAGEQCDRGKRGNGAHDAVGARDAPGLATKARRHEAIETEDLRAFVASRPYGKVRRICARLDLLGGNSRVVVLQRADAESLLPERADRLDGGGGARQRGDARHLMHHRGPANSAIVEERLTSERCVENEIDLAVDDLVRDVRPP